MNALKIFGQNQINDLCTITVSSRDDIKNNIVDDNYNTKWQSTGAGPHTITITNLKTRYNTSGGLNFNRIILQNTNIAAMTAEYYNASTNVWVAIPEAALTLTTANKVIEITTAILTSGGFRLTVTTMQSGTKVYLGQLRLCLSIVDGTQQWLSNVSRQDEQKAGSIRLGEGKLVFWREWTKFAAAVTLFDVTQTDHDILFPFLTPYITPLMDGQKSFGGTYPLTFVFYDDVDPAEIFEAFITSAPNHVMDRKTGLYEISMEMQQT